VEISQSLQLYIFTISGQGSAASGGIYYRSTLAY